MDDQRIKQAVLAVLEQTLDARSLASAIERTLGGTSPANSGARAESTSNDSRVSSPHPGLPPPGNAGNAGNAGGTRKLLERIVLGDILDDGILTARPEDRTFPLRILFADLGSLLVADSAPREPQANEAVARLPHGQRTATDEERTHLAEQAFALASGLNFFFRAAMDGESKVRVGVEVSRQLYALAHDAQRLGVMAPESIAKATPLLATIMNHELDRVRFESIDHMKTFDSQVHERTNEADATSSRILRPATFLCRITTNNAIKAKAQVVT